MTTTTPRTGRTVATFPIADGSPIYVIENGPDTYSVVDRAGIVAPCTVATFADALNVAYRWAGWGELAPTATECADAYRTGRADAAAEATNAATAMRGTARQNDRNAEAAATRGDYRTALDAANYARGNRCAATELDNLAARILAD